MNKLQILDDILYKGLQPWLPENNPDEKYAAMLSEIKVIESDLNLKYVVDFPRPFNNKTKYYQRVIFREMNTYCNLVINQIADNNDIRVKKYWLNDTLDKKLKTRLKEIGKLIKERQLDFIYIDSSKITFEKDTGHKTDTYIIQLLKICLMKIYLEIQNKFMNLREEVMLIDDFYTQFLFEPVPSNSHIKETPPILSIESEKPTIVTPFIPAPSISYLSFTYKKTVTNPENLNDLCDSLKKHNFIAANTSVTNFKKIFSGKEITQPVEWIGNSSEFYYFIHLIYTKNKLVDDLKQKQWKIACQCFVQSDGRSFDPSKLRALKKPQLTAKLLDQAVSLIK